jgi:hypothetical protein
VNFKKNKPLIKTTKMINFLKSLILSSIVTFFSWNDINIKINPMLIENKTNNVIYCGLNKDVNNRVWAAARAIDNDAYYLDMSGKDKYPTPNFDKDYTIHMVTLPENATFSKKVIDLAHKYCDTCTTTEVMFEWLNI